MKKKIIKNNININKRISCQYYPCHFPNQDCTFCYCPYYPCLDERTKGKYVFKDNSKVWSCSNCKIIHIPEISSKLVHEIMNGKNIDRFWNKKIEPLLNNINKEAIFL